MSTKPANTRVTTPLETARLRLLACAPAQLVALMEHPEQFESIVGFPAADGLRGFYTSGDVSPEWLAALRQAVAEPADPWRHGFFIIEKDAGTVIGSAGFKGAPDADGMVEIAYGVVPAREGQGFATEAAGALMRFAVADPRVRLLRAHTLPEPNASTHVLRKCGFVHVGAVVDPDDGLVWRWERNAPHIGTA